MSSPTEAQSQLHYSVTPSNLLWIIPIHTHTHTPRCQSCCNKREQKSHVSVSHTPSQVPKVVTSNRLSRCVPWALKLSPTERTFKRSDGIARSFFFFNRVLSARSAQHKSKWQSLHTKLECCAWINTCAARYNRPRGITSMGQKIHWMCST